MRRASYKKKFALIIKIFIGLLTGPVNWSNHTECVLLSNQKCTTQRTFINWHTNEYSQKFPCYPFAVKLGRCVGSCNNINDLSKYLFKTKQKIWI